MCKHAWDGQLEILRPKINYLIEPDYW